MYQKYRVHSARVKQSQENTTDGNLRPISVDHVESSGTQEEDLEQQMKRVWETIERTVVPTATVGNRKRSGQEWSNVRLFVSSTFTDFHCERELLVKKVFPSLHEWCQTHKLHFIECDLRWGVPKDATSSVAIETCLEELERCREETDGAPFFLCTLGQKYGWRPEEGDVDEMVRSKYQWIPGLSITHMEILCGAYRLDNPNAVFLVRDGAFISSVEEHLLHRFQDKDEEAAHHLTTLKKKLQSKFKDRCLSYSCSYGGVREGVDGPQVNLDGLEDFGEKVERVMKDIIQKHYPSHFMEVEEETSQELDVDAATHHHAAELRAVAVSGRSAELTLLKTYVFPGNKENREDFFDKFKPGSDKDNSDYCKELDSFGVTEADRSIFAVIGQGGIGKSTLLSSLALELLQMNDVVVMYHAVGIVPDSFLERNILQRILLSFPITEDEVSRVKSDEVSVSNLLDLWKSVLKRFRESNKRWVIIIDGINQMTQRENSTHLHWLPPRVPHNMNIIVSLRNETNISWHRIQRKQAYYLMLDQLPASSRRLLVEEFFARYNKKLDEKQLELLITRESAGIPLWLRTACEELRVFGSFRALTSHISSLANDLSGLLQAVLGRLVREDETGCIAKVLCLMACSLGGLPEEHIPLLLKSCADNEEDVSLLTWATVRVRIKSLLTEAVNKIDAQPRMQFVHSCVYEAVEQTLLHPEAEKQKWHKILANVYEQLSETHKKVGQDLPHHLMMAKENKRLIQFFRQNRMSQQIPMHTRAHYANAIRCQQFSAPNFQSNSDFMLCQLCARKFSLLGPTGVAKDQCVVCGFWIPNQVHKVSPPRVCAFHMKPVPPGRVLCRSCGFFITGDIKPHGPAVTCKLCFNCGLGRGHNQCCQLLE